MIRLTELMILAEPEPDKEMLEKVHWLYEHTDTDIDIPLSQLEMLCFYQLQSGSGLNKEIEINDKTYKIIDLYRYLDRVNQRLVEIVVKISKKYNLDIPLMSGQTTRLQM